MERKKQFGNVTFGSDWSETLLDHEQVAEAVATIETAAQDCAARETRGASFDAVLSLFPGGLRRGR